MLLLWGLMLLLHELGHHWRRNVCMGRMVLLLVIVLVMVVGLSMIIVLLLLLLLSL